MIEDDLDRRSNAGQKYRQIPCATLESRERRLEYLDRLIPRIADCTAEARSRIEIARYDNPVSSESELTCNSPRLIGIHHDDQIGVVHAFSRDRPGLKAR